MSLDAAKIAGAMDEALHCARQAEAQDEVPVGAVVLDAQGAIIGRGYNLRESEQDPTAHAELLALREAARTIGSWRLEGCTLIVTLEPCPMCLGASQQSRVERVVYGATDPKGGAISLGYRLHEDQRTNHRFKLEHLATPACGAILSAFFSKKRRPLAGS